MIRLLLIINITLFLLMVGCGGGNSGGGTETGDPGDMNATEFSGGLISGKVSLDAQETINLEGAKIWLDGDSKLLKKSDSGGDFLIEGLSTGDHELFVEWTSGEITLLGKSKVFFIGESNSSQKPSVYIGQTIIVDAPASFQGIIQSNDDVNVEVKLKNSIFVSKVQTNTGFELTDIPFGTYTLEIYQNGQLKLSKEINLLAGGLNDIGIISID
ncbi:MAG: hypothetical protein COA79_03955 [Planctomycetota bacterium]|nr:MAG: hypothetical protein COA79_03955 [Planctomycetota bacterium]